MAVPTYGELPPLAMNAHRFLVAKESVYLEVKRPWLHVALDLFEHAGGFPMPLPYGDYDERPYEVAFDWREHAFPLLSRFIDEAAAASPTEHAAWLVWNAETRELEYRRLAAIAASAGGISYHYPMLEGHESLAIDLHSHGALNAFFSPTDDEDDRGAVKIAGVIGNLDATAPGWQFRLSALGLFVELDLDDSMRCRVCGCTSERACAGGCNWVRPDLCSACL